MIEVTEKPQDFDNWAGLMALLREAFAFMEGRIDPPSSLHRLTEQGLAAKGGEEFLVLAIEDGSPVGCLFAQRRTDCFYLGKIAVAPGSQGRGIGRRMVSVVEKAAITHDVHWLELQTRIELTENHRAFAALGFEKVGQTCHPGFSRPTSITMRKKLSADSTERQAAQAPA